MNNTLKMINFVAIECNCLFVYIYIFFTVMVTDSPTPYNLYFEGDFFAKTQTEQKLKRDLIAFICFFKLA